MRIIVKILICILFVTSQTYASGAFPLNSPSLLLIGAKQPYTVKEKETLIELARKFNVGYNEMVHANSSIDPWVPEKGSTITVPTFWLLPEQMEKGILINLAEMRLYYFFALNKNKYVKTYPIGIGVAGSDTPTGNYKITAKVKNPVWNVPASIRKEDPELPAFVLPGPDNPLGGYWLQLSVNGYGIHGTNRPLGIGRRVSHGCIRLYPEDIKVLFTLVRPGTNVRIIDEPVKVGAYKEKVYIEVNRSGQSDPELITLAVKKLSRKRLLEKVDTQRIISAIKSATGLPAIISR